MTTNKAAEAAKHAGRIAGNYALAVGKKGYQKVKRVATPPPRAIALSLIALLIVAGCPYLLTQMNSDATVNIDEQIAYENVGLVVDCFTYTDSGGTNVNVANTGYATVIGPDVTGSSYIIDNTYVLPDGATFAYYTLPIIFSEDVPAYFDYDISGFVNAAYAVYGYWGGVHSYLLASSVSTISVIDVYRLKMMESPTLQLDLRCNTGYSSEMSFDITFYHTEVYNTSEIVLFACGTVLLIMAMLATPYVNMLKKNRGKDAGGDL